MQTRLLAILATSLFLATPIWAQTFGDISGEVKDATGAVVGGATVTVTNTATNAARTTSSNEAGRYSFPALPPGEYQLKAEKAGFKTATRTGLALQVQQSARVDL